MGAPWYPRVRSHPVHSTVDETGFAWPSHPKPTDIDLRVWREADAAVLQWTIPAGTSEVVGRPSWIPEGSTWLLERSGSPFGPWYPVGNECSIEVRTCLDTDVPLARSESRFLFYRLGLKLNTDPVQVRYYGRDPQWTGGVPGGVTWGMGGTPSHLVPGDVRSARADMEYAYRCHVGTPALLYRPNWLSPIRPGNTNPNTGTISSYGKARGQNVRTRPWDHPVRTYVQTRDGAIQLQRIAGRVHDLPAQLSGESLHWPPLQQNDVLRLLNGRVFEVGGVAVNALLGHTISFALSLVPLPLTHAVSALPMPEGFREVALTPRRNTAHVTNVEAYTQAKQVGPMTRASILPQQSTTQDLDD